MSWPTTLLPIGELILADFDGTWGGEPTGEAGTPVIRSTDMRGGKLNLESPARRSIPASVVEKKRLQNGDILVTKSSGSAHLVGASILFAAPAGETYVCSNFTRCLRPNPALVEPEFLYFGLQSPQFKEQVFGAHRTTSGLRNLRIEEFKSGELPVPSLDEQRRIVSRLKECLSRVDEIETLRTNALCEAEYLAPSLYAAIESENQYPRMKLSDVILSSRNGRSIKQENGKGNGSVLTLTAVRDITLDCDASKSVSFPDDVATQFRISEGDVFVSRSNTRELVGLAAVAPDTPIGRVIYPDLLIKLVPNPKFVRPRFLAYALRTSESRWQIKERALGSSQTMVKISGKRLKEVEIPVPPLDSQDELIAKFDELHDLSASLVAEMESIDVGRLRESILRKAFAGEL